MCIVVFGILYLPSLKVEGGMVKASLMLADFVIYGSFILFYLPPLLLEGNFKLIRFSFMLLAVRRAGDFCVRL